MSELKVISKFAGEAFGTDNIRTVYAGEAQDTERRPDRTIILVGPIGAGKSSFIDFLCNYFYGAKFDSAFRYKIADEIFDSTTPDKAVTKYVFNATKLTYRPIIIDTPGIGDPHGVKADRELAKLVSDYLSAASKERFHAVCLILPSYMHTINQQIDDDLHLTLSLFPDWMKKNIVPLITYSDFGEYDTNLLKHFGLEDNNRFFLNNEFLFRKISVDPNRQSEERQVWSRNERNIIEFLRYIGSLRPQTISRRLPSESEPLNQDFEEERRVRSSRETITYLLETDEVKQIREEFTEHSGSPKRLSGTHRAATSTVFQTPVNKPLPNPIGQRVETRTVLGENRSNIPIGQGAALKDMNRKETFIENIEETVENLELLRRYIYDPTTRTYRIEYAHEVKVHESRRSSQGGSYSDLRRISPTRGGDASREILDVNRGMRRNTSAPNLEKDSNKENQTRLDYSPQMLKKLLGDAIMNESARGIGQQTTISPVRPQVVRMPFDPNEFERQSRQQQRPSSRTQPIGQGAQFEPAPVSQGSPDRSLDKTKDGIFERNSSSRQSLHNSPIRHGGVRHAIVTKDPNAIGQEIAQPTQRPVIQPLPRGQTGQQIRQAQPLPAQNGQGQIAGQVQRQAPGYGQNFDPNRPGGQIGQNGHIGKDGRFDPNQTGNQGQNSNFDPNRPAGQIGQDGRLESTRPQGQVQSAVQSPDPRYAVPQRPLVISQQTLAQGPGYWVGQRGREIEDTTITRQYPQGGPQNASQPGQGRPRSGIGQPIGEGSYDPNRQSQNQPYPYDSTGQTAGYPLRPGTGRGIAPPTSGQGVDPRYQQGLSNAPQQSFDPNRQSGPSPYVRTDVHGVRTDYIGTRDGRWVEKRGYEITRDDLLTPKDVDPGLNDQQRLLNPNSRRSRKPAKKRGPLFNCCFYVVAPLVVIGVVATVIVTLVLLA